MSFSPSSPSLTNRSAGPSRATARRGRATLATLATPSTPRREQVTGGMRARQSMPSMLTGTLSTPRSSQTLPYIRTAAYSSPKRTPGVYAPTVAKRCDVLTTNATTILDLYEDWMERLQTPEADMQEDLDQQLNRYWDSFSSSKKHQVLAKRDVYEHFLDPLAVMRSNDVEADSELGEEVGQAITAVNRATFVHYVAQLPFRDSSTSTSTDGARWTLHRFASYLEQASVSRWPIREISELLAARRDFLKRIATRRPRVGFTLDDLHLFNDLTTQIAIYYLWEYRREENAGKRAKMVKTKLNEMFELGSVTEALALGTVPGSDVLDALEDEHAKIVEVRRERFEELNNDAEALQAEYPYADTLVALLSYVSAMRQSPSFPLEEVLPNIMIPRHHTFSPTLLSELRRMRAANLAGTESEDWSGPERTDEDSMEQDVEYGSQEDEAGQKLSASQKQATERASSSRRSIDAAAAREESARRMKQRRSKASVEVQEELSDSVDKEGGEESSEQYEDVAGRKAGKPSAEKVRRSERMRDKSARTSGDEQPPADRKTDQTRRSSRNRANEGGSRSREEIDTAATPMGKKQSLRFNKEARLERVDDGQQGPSIVRRRGVVESVRDHEFDEGDSDVFQDLLLAKQAKRIRRTRRAKALAPAETEVEGDGEGNEQAQEQEDADETSGTTSTRRRTGKKRATGSHTSRASRVEDDEEFELSVDEEQLEAERRESEKRKAERKRKREREREEEGADSGSIYEPSASGETAEVKHTRERSVYRYATGGNRHGRVPWSDGETECLVNCLRELHDGNHRFIWKEVLRLHGVGGRSSEVLKNRNNVQLKDKARNEVERMVRAKMPVPNWMQPYG